METCNICCEKLNKSNHKEVICLFCNYSTCRECFQKYISESNEDPDCMNCKKKFNRIFIYENCTSLFINTILKKHREELLFDREKAMLPETQPYVLVELEKQKIDKQVDALRNEKFAFEKEIKTIDTKIALLYSNRYRLHVDTLTKEPNQEKKKFIRKCPMTDCRGFLSSRWKCGSCETQICSVCNEEKVNLDTEGNHMCNPDNVLNMELLNKDTKPCPSCGTMIYRISGCSMMFCVDCHTAWDWNTHRIVTSGTIHNPHYYDFIRQNGNAGRDHGDIPCGGLPDVYTMRSIFNKFTNLVENKKIIDLYNIHNVINHIMNVEIQDYFRDPVVYNRNLRINYLMNNLSEGSFKQQLQTSEKTIDKKNDFNNIYQMFVNVASDIFAQIYVELNNKRILKEQGVIFLNNNYDILVNLVNYFNENLKKIAKMYKVVNPGITDKYNWVKNLEAYNKQLK